MLKINGEVAEGVVSVSEKYDYSQKNMIIKRIDGLLETPWADLTSIQSIDCVRFSLTGCRLQSRSYGSEDNSVVYAFTADKMELRPEGFIGYE